MIITIDGPVASGKSTVAQQLAQRLGFYYLNTGILYRAVAYVIAHEKPEKIRAKKALLEASDLTFVKDVTYTYSDGKAAIAYHGHDLTPHLYDAVLDQQASIISALPVVREALLGLQRSIAKTSDVVADGRDCGTVVFPQADVKFYLTADVTTRAERLMHGDRKYTGMNLPQVIAAVQERDLRDQNRSIAPLKVPHDAITIDSTSMAIDAVVERMVHVVRSTKSQPPA